MAKFPPNLDDGELWLPSDIFVHEVPTKYSTQQVPCMEDLTRQFSAFNLLQPNQTLNIPKAPPNLAPNSKRFIPPVRYGSVNPISSECFSVNGDLELGQRLYSHRTGLMRAGPRPVLECHFVRPTIPQFQSFLETRARVLQEQQNHLKTRVLPFQGSRFGSAGGFVRESGGTGVFLPRVGNSTTKTTSIIPTDTRKKQVGLRNKLQIQGTQQRKSMKRRGVGKEDKECHCPPPPEKGLPQEWTY